MKVVVDKFAILEWMKSPKFNAEISSYGLCKLNLASDLNWGIR